jgi:hypothetical protein
MKEKIQKLATLNKEAVELLKAEDMDGAIAKHAEIQDLTKEMETDAEVETPEVEAKPEVVETPEEIAKSEEIKKFVSLNVSADTMKALLDDVASLKDSLKDMSTINKRLDDVEKAKGISKQASETVNKTGESVWDDMPL